MEEKTKTDASNPERSKNQKETTLRNVSIILSCTGIILIIVSICLHFGEKELFPGLPISPLPVLGALLFLAGTAGFESLRAMSVAKREHAEKNE